MARPRQFDPDVAVATAMDVFWRNGYGATTPAALVDALGIGKGSLYNAFENKHALFEQALRRYGDERVAGLVEVLNRQGPVKARLRAALMRLAAPENAHLVRRGCLAVNTATELGAEDVAINAIVRGVFERMERAFQSVIREGQRSGELRTGRDAKELGSLLLTTTIGMTVIAKTVSGPKQLRRIVRGLMSLI